MINYIEKFPIKDKYLPETLRELLTPITPEHPSEKVVVTSRFNHDKHGENRESLQMIMATVPEEESYSIATLRESRDGVVSFSVPFGEQKGDVVHFEPSVSGHDYIVASWGDGSHYSYSLSEKVWMTLGLSPRVLGNSEQKIIYDDLSLPVTAVAEGDIANEYYWQQSRDVHWTMQNDYLRKYLWLRGHCGIRVFFYEALVEDTETIRKIMNGKSHFNSSHKDNWFELDIREHRGKLLLQVWASVVGVEPKLCEELDKNSLIWPGDTEPMTRDRATSINSHGNFYLNDRFLEKYEKNSIYDASIFKSSENEFLCSPSYKGQWAFNECIRVGRNLIKIPIYELYKGVPSKEVVHAHNYAISEIEAKTHELSQEHIASKSYRLLGEVITLGENLSKMSQEICESIIPPENFVEFEKTVFDNEGINSYPIFRKLAQVAPLDMYEQDFLSRCKTLHEIIGRFKPGSLKKLMIPMGCTNKELSQLRGLKLIQGISNILKKLNTDFEGASSLVNSAQEIDWKKTNEDMAFFFINNDLRIADAHENIGESIGALEKLGFDSRTIVDGYGTALDYLLDGVINTFRIINKNAKEILNR